MYWDSNLNPLNLQSGGLPTELSGDGIRTFLTIKSPPPPSNDNGKDNDIREITNHSLM